jgi:glycosyltransferase involved in cell wall biosynthesis
MSVYNGERFLREAIDGIKHQTLSDFEFIILDDDSRDNTRQILEEYAAEDHRISVIRNERNLGLTRSLNKGLKLCCGKYVARQDADDVSLPDRLENQVEYLENHPEVGVVGSWVAIIDENGREGFIRKYPTSPAMVKWSLFFKNSLAHSSVLIRRSLLEDTAYRSEVSYSQDYDLWARLSEKTEFANIPQVLYKSRKHDEMISVRYRDEQRQTGNRVRQQLISNTLGEKVSLSLIMALKRAIKKQVLEYDEEVLGVANLIKRLCQQYAADHKEFDKNEKGRISREAARQILDIGLHYSRIKPQLTIRVMLKGLSLNWRVLRLSDVKTLARNTFFYVLSGDEEISPESTKAPLSEIGESLLEPTIMHS